MDCIQLSCGAIIYPSRTIHHPKGDILHGLKRSDSGFVDFGEAYFSKIEYGAIKGWKKHLRMSMNLLVPIGSIRFYLCGEFESPNEHVILGEGNYARLFVPPCVWVAFEGIGCGMNLLMNLASIEHDPSESIIEEYRQ